ncbi:hypothetical protein LOTGIDRAFT_171137 [Lottia gigantea]|uniref:EGF-like domain-containing protein n=1 Tax=Lottia gigantea TaxID=225164 RepID=V4BC72_LOTGI|nr:hypothetical protein LOTGIDRAFT_171137 [Lottia gigantea]ESP03707.1 hypothetical protein LOTGIDRAFT_171137 [Lottia gigantea]
MAAALILSIILGLICQINGLDTDHWGTYFVTSFIRHSPGADYIIIITTREVSRVKITDHGSGYTNFVTIGANKSHAEVFNDTVIPVSSLEVIESMAISVESSVKVSVYGFSNFLRSSDGFLVLPVATLGTEYLAINYDQGFPQILVAAVENKTIVDIEMTVPNICLYNSTPQVFNIGEVFTFTMDEFDLIPVYCARDCTGMKITANKPVAVLSGNLCVKIPATSVCDHIAEMLTPTSEFGTLFIIVSPIGQDHISFFRVLALENETTVFTGNANFTIDAYKHITFGAPTGVNQCLNTTKPVLVAQYMTGRTAITQSENYTGDGYMVLIPPVDRYPTNYVIDTSFLHNDVISYMVTIFDWDVDSCLYGYTVNEISGIHTNSTRNSMGVIIYGVDFRAGYAYLAGLKLTSFSGQEKCKKKPCKNGGWCLEMSFGYKCRCFKGFTGTQCNMTDISNQVHSQVYSEVPDTIALKTLTASPTSTLVADQLSDLTMNPTSFVSSTLSPFIRESESDSYELSIPSEEDYTTESLLITQSDRPSHGSGDLNVFENSFTTVFKIPETEIFEASEIWNEESLSKLFPNGIETTQYSPPKSSHLEIMSSSIPLIEPSTFIVDKNTVSKTFYLKNSAVNRKESEKDLGIVSVLFVIIITSVVIISDITSYFQNEYSQLRKSG